MKYAEYPLFAEGYINRFLTTGSYTSEQKFTKATLSGRVNEWLKQGFAIHENPCRKEFIEKRRAVLPEYLELATYLPGEKVKVFEQENDLQLYFPFGNIGVEASGFYYTPTYLRSYHYVVIRSEKALRTEFEISTCGGVTVWVNDNLVTDYTPFTRNRAKSTNISVDLKAGENKFVICHDDLAERDTDYYFRIRRIGDSELKILLPVADKTRLDELINMERTLEHIYFEKEAYISEPVKLRMRNFGKRPLPVQVTITPGEFIEKMEAQEELIETREYLLEQEKSSVLLLDPDEIRPGYYYFTVRLETDGIVLGRKIGNQLVNESFLDYADESLAARKARAMQTVLQYGVNNVYKAALLFASEGDLKQAEEIIFRELAGVRKRKDCSDFHFIIILYIYCVFDDKLSRELKAEIVAVMLGYRYWIDEPGDDVMWFFSENHALLFHVCQYLAGRALPERIFSNSGLSGKELYQKATGLLNKWFQAFFDEFITEWNSNAYIPVDVLGIGTLYNLTEKDQELHHQAKRALDMICYSLCINEHKGVVMTSFGRTYEKELKGNYNAGTTGLLYTMYNAGFLNRAGIGYLSVILGDYEAPAEYRKYLKLSGEQELIFQNTQGFEQHVNLYLYKNAAVTLSTAVGFSPFGSGYQEHIVQAAIDALAQVFINHPGESHPYGSGRPNFWVGNGVLPMAMQYRDTAILKYDIDVSHRIDYTHAYIPLAEFQQYQGDSYSIVLEKDGGYIGVKALNGLKLRQSGPTSHREFISSGRLNVWVIRVARSCEYENLKSFLQTFQQLEIKMNQKKEVIVTDHRHTEYFINDQNECFVNGGTIYQYPLSVAGIVELKGKKE